MKTASNPRPLERLRRPMLSSWADQQIVTMFWEIPTFCRMYIRPGISCYQKDLRDRNDPKLIMTEQTSAISISLRPNAASDISTGDPSIITVVKE